MTRQKTFKSQVRARAARTGERYTAARSRLLERAEQRPEPPDASSSAGSAAEPMPTAPDVEMPATDDALRRSTARGWHEWLAELDRWGAAARTHTETARWLVDEQGVAGWWAQAITVGYERARGLRAKHQTAGGFSVGVSRTINASAAEVLEAFTDDDRRAAWLGDAAVRWRSSRAGRGARFDWLADESRLVIEVSQKSDAKTVLSVQHERLPDAAAADRMKQYWRDRLGALKVLLEGPAG